jgi:hypothetical protein
MDHLAGCAIDLDRSALEQAAELSQEELHLVPAHRLLAHREARRPADAEAADETPGASSSMEAIAAAVTIGWRSEGTATPVPIEMREVASAIRPRLIQTSPNSAGES